MNKFRFLIAEDDMMDLEIMVKELENSLSFPFDTEHVDNRENFLKALKKSPDIILCDYNLIQYNGLQALRDTLQFSKLIPFIMVTGSLSEEKAAEVIKAGAWEYVVKERLYRLSSAIEKSLVRKENLERQTKLESAVKALNKCLLSLESNSRKNIKKLVNVTGEILDCACLLYNRLEEDSNLLCTWGIWNKPEDYEPKDKPEGHICYDVIKSNESEPVIYNDLTGTIYEKVDPNVIKYNIKSYLGFPIKLEDNTVGSFCLCDTKKRNFSDVDIQIITMFGQAVANEERRLAENKKLQESEKRFRGIYENTTIGLYRTTPSGEIVMANPTLVKMLGYNSVEDLKKRNLEKDGYHPSYSRESFKARFKDSDVTKGIDAKWSRKDGSHIHVLESAVAMRDEEGKIQYYDGAVENITEKKKFEDKVKHLNRILLSIRSVNRLIVKEKEQQPLIEKICESLIKFGSYDNAWLILLDEQKNYITSAQAGLGKEFNKLKNLFKKGDLTRCAKKVLESGELQINDNPTEDCPDCPLAYLFSHAGSYTTRLTHNNKIYGLLTVSLSVEFLHLEEEKDLFLEITDDIAFALHDIEIEQKRRETEKSLIENEKKYRRLFEESSDPNLILQNDTFIDTNKTTIEFLKYADKNEIINKKPWDISPEYQPDGERSIEKAKRLIKTAIKKGHTHFEWVHLDKNNNEHYVDVALTHLPEAGKGYIYTVWRDLSKRKEKEHALQESRNLLKEAQRIAQLGSWKLDLKSNKLTWSDEVYRIFGIEPQEFPASYEAFLKYVHPDDRQKVDTTFKDSLETGEDHYEIDHRILRKNGEIRFVHEQCVHIRDANDRVIRSVGMVQDITERKQNEEELRLQKIYFEKLFDSSPEAITILDNNDRIQDINNEFSRLFGYTETEAIGKPINELIVPDHLKKEGLKATKDVAKGETINFETVRKDKNGNLINVSILGKPIKLAGEQIAVYGIFRDITQREKAEQAIRESEEKYRTLVNNLPVGISRSTPQGSYVSANPTYLNIFGYKDLEDLNKHTAYSIYENKNVRDKLLQKLQKEKQLNDHIIKQRRKDGKEIWISANYKAIIEKKKIKFLDSVILDITQRMQSNLTQTVQRAIALSVNQTADMNELYEAIKQNIGKLMDTTNFYVAIYNKDNDTISLPYHVDQKDDFKSYPAGKTLTAYVIKSGQPLIADSKKVDELTKKGLIETIGAKSKIWLGVPLKVENDVIGMISVQSYTNSKQFTEKDLKLLEFVSGQIALAIDRKRKQQEIIDSLKEKEVLLKEVHHRVKNNMNVITSLLNLQSTNITSKEDAILAFNESKNRIYAMSMVHKLLYEVESFSEVKLKEYLEVVMNKLVYAYQQQKIVKWNIAVKDDVSIDINKAVPFGLIFNEVVTNSMKYAFIGRKSGNINIKIKKKQNNIIHFVFQDNGVGIENVEEKLKSGTLGFRLITILTKQIDGDIKISGDKGTKIEVIFESK